ncbi:MULTISPECIES: hypothetical protein [unclassified Pedobacter]|nr:MULTISPECIES: hypothetical protein [unclassified Pedobacter]
MQLLLMWALPNPVKYGKGAGFAGLCRAALRSGTDEGSVLNPYNP